MPEEEHICHSPGIKGVSTTDSQHSNGPTEVRDSDMTDALRFDILYVFA